MNNKGTPVFKLGIIIVSSVLFVSQGFTQDSAVKAATWIQSRYTMKPGAGRMFKTMNPCYPFPGRKNSIIRVPATLNGLTGARDTTGANSLQLKFEENVNVLIALPQGVKPTVRDAKLVIDSGLTLTGLPPFQVYSISYKKGWQTIDYTDANGFIAAVIKSNQDLSFQNAHFPDGRKWRPYTVDGYTDNKQLFEIMAGSDDPVIDEGFAGTEGIQGGFEGGTCVKVGNSYHLFPTERAGETGVDAYYDRVKTRIGHWESSDAIHWKRVGTIYQSSGKYAILEEDNPMNDRRAAIWSYNAVFNEKEDRWYGYYLTYTVDRNIRPNHSFGRIWCTKSQTKGMNGIGGPYDEGQLIMEPGLDSQPWEGRQGVASFYPYPVKDGWLGFYAGAFPYHSWADYPKTLGTGWYIGLAKSKTMDGPWTRLDTAINPVKTMNPDFLENPLVYRLQNGGYIAMFDGGPDDNAHPFVNMIGYALSKDGLHWGEARYIPLHTKIKRWWNTMRTPLCLIPEGADQFTVLFAAVASKRFHPIGRVKLRMRTAMLEALLKD